MSASHALAAVVLTCLSVAGCVVAWIWNPGGLSYWELRVLIGLIGVCLVLGLMRAFGSPP